MAKRFKFRICRVFQSCRSKDPSALPSNPVPSFLPPTPPKPPRSSLKRHVTYAFESVGCVFRSRPTLSDADDCHHEPQVFRWEQQDKWHVVAKVCAPDNCTTPRRKIYSSSVSGASDDDDDVLPLPPPPRVRKKKGRVKKKKTTPRFRMSTSSADSCGLFSSDGYDDMDEEETETLVSSSRSFSTDSSSFELNPQLESICETPSQHHRVMKIKPNSKKKKNKKKNKKNKKDRRASCSSSPARVSMLLRLVPCSVEGKVRDSFAVVKRSEDPYEDFRRSMMEMILEKQIFEDTDLEQLLHCFLSLNSSEHHGVIVQVFAEIWQALFTAAPATFRE
ncbi:transcription repressor OFP7-like [Prosopis cineraria]|uniref:transcription repressor OFP7-like n=1 Tax=Prosopis cineraria TaxID=364024 RepID=UPI00240EA305|nr:transcription repressor OFP7-like [Prosopis cineraria]